jgi:hypothetical protein
MYKIELNGYEIYYEYYPENRDYIPYGDTKEVYVTPEHVEIQEILKDGICAEDVSDDEIEQFELEILDIIQNETDKDF